MLDKMSGKADYAIMSFGGFLGIGDRYHPLPWQALTYDPRQGGYVVDIDRSRLEGAPRMPPMRLPRGMIPPMVGGLTIIMGYHMVPMRH